jgi:hypothetical protein
MEETRQSEIKSALAAGRLEGISIPDLLWALCQQERTGILRVSRTGVEKSIFFEQGQIVFAASSDPDDRLGERLLRQGLITLDQLIEAVMQLRTGKRLGALLVEAGSLEPDQLVAGVLSQVEAIVLDLFSWEEGDYRFEEGPLPTEEVITLGMKTGELLLKGIRTIRSFGRIRESVGAPHTSYGLSPDGAELLEQLDLSANEELLLERLRDGEASVETLCKEVLLSNFEIYQTIWGLRILGTVEARESILEGSVDAALRGSLSDAGFADLLVSLSRSEATGVLYINRRHHERTFHLAKGRCVFATSSDPEDGLIAYLLRRGVISLSDREETAKRLLSNKRVGTILRDMGVIDDADLREMVKQQISEIVLNTFRWDDAYYAFVAGELPSNEEITLDENLDRLVAEGLRRVTSWERVSRGCGSSDAPLQLTSSFLDVLDGMGAGPQEWQVVAALKEPRSPRQLCAMLELGDFRIFQILWALNALGAVEKLPEPEPEPAPEEADEPESEAFKIEVIDLDETPSPEETQVIARERVEEYIAEKVDECIVENSDEPEATQVIARERVEEYLAEEPDVPEEEPIISREAVEEYVAEKSAEAVDSQSVPLAEATQIIPRDAVERSLAQPEPEPEEEFEPPSDLEQIIARFNSTQRLVYRAIRAEVGAGAVNFIRSCCDQISPAPPESLLEVELQPDGSWSEEDLKRAVIEKRISDPWSEYRKLIEIELEVLKEHLGEARALELQRQVEEVGDQTARPPV